MYKMSSNFSPVSETPSIPDIIQPLKSSFFDSDFENAQQLLLARDTQLHSTLLAKCDALEHQLRQLKSLDQANDQKVRDLTRDLCLFKDKEEKSAKRYDALLAKLREWETSQKASIFEMAALRDELEVLKGKLRAKLGVEIDGFCNKIEVLEVENKNLNAHVEKIQGENEVLKDEIGKVNALVVELKRDKDERVKEAMDKLESVMKKVEVLEVIIRVCLARGEEIEDIRKKNASLEEEIVELRRNDAEKCEKIKEILMKNECLEREKGEAIRERDEKTHELDRVKEGREMEMAKFGWIEDKLLKLEEDVFTCLCSNLKRDVTFSSTKFGKILTEIERNFDSQEVGITCKDQGTGALLTPMVSEAEKSKENRHTGIAEDNFVILDSDDNDDDENLICVSSVKSKRWCSESLTENLDSSIDGSLDLKHKKMKIKDVAYDQVNHGSSTQSDTRSDNKFYTLQRQTIATLRKYEERLSRCVGGAKDNESNNYAANKAE